MLGQRIRERRCPLNWSQVERSKRLGVTKQMISNWENGNIQPSVAMLMRLTKTFNVATDYLVGVEVALHLNVEGLPLIVVTYLAQSIDDFRKESFAEQ